MCVPIPPLLHAHAAPLYAWSGRVAHLTHKFMGSDWCLAELLIIYPESLLQSPRGGVVFYSWKWGLWAKKAVGEEGAADLGSGAPFQMLLW